MATSPRVLVLLADGAEEMEVTIIVDVLRRAAIDVVLAGLAGAAPVTCSRGVRIVPDVPIEEAMVAGDEFDMVILPGGLDGTKALADSAAVGDLLRRQVESRRCIGAICAAPMALAAHGVGGGEKMTSHPSVREVVAAHGVWTEAAVVDTPLLITSQGPGTAFEFALAVVARLVDVECATALRAAMVLPSAT